MAGRGWINAGGCGWIGIGGRWINTGGIRGEAAAEAAAVAAVVWFIGCGRSAKGR